LQDKFGPQCPKDAEIVQLSAKWKATILDWHNKGRNIVALGQLKGFLPAVQMPQLVTTNFQLFIIYLISLLLFKKMMT
jgi:hypothetical protein